MSMNMKLTRVRKSIFATIGMIVMAALALFWVHPASAQPQNPASATAGASSSARVDAGVDQNSAQPPEGTKFSGLSSGTKIDATLANSIDAKKNKPGDRVEARTAQDVKQDGKVVLKKGTRLVGRVTRVQPRADDRSQSQLGVLFDHAALANGQEIPLNAQIQALAMVESSMNTAAAMGSDDVMASDHAGGSAGGMGRAGGGGAPRGGANGGAIGGIGSTAGGIGSTASGAAGGTANTTGRVPVNASGTLNSASRSTGSVGGLTPTGRLAPNSTGVFGLDGLSIDAVASNATNGSLIVSSTKNVHLDSGTQMLLSVSGGAQ